MNVPGLISGPRVTFGSMMAECWQRGPEADRRIRQLRKALGRSVSTRSYEHREKLWSAPGADRRTVQAVEITYCAPRGVVVPPIAAEQPRRAIAVWI